MGNRSETVAVGWKDHEFRSRKAHDVGISPQEDRGGTKGTVGEGQGAEEEGCLAPTEPATFKRR
jgi:hypothetical protein